VRLSLATAIVLLPACTGTQSTIPQTYQPCEEAFQIRSVEVGIDDASLDPDRAARARDIQLPRALRGKLLEFLVAADFIDEVSGGDSLALVVNSFRLPASARWMTGQAKGNDYLGVQLSVERGSERRYATDAIAQIGAGDRSIGANYSANWALESLIDMLSFEIAWNLARVSGRGEQAVLEKGKQESIMKAIRILKRRGELSQAEIMKYAAIGKVGFAEADEGAPCVPPEVWRRAQGQRP